MMRGVSEIVPLARQFPGIVQIAQALPISFVKCFNPLMAKFSEFERVSCPIRFSNPRDMTETRLFFEGIPHGVESARLITVTCQLVRLQVSEIFNRYSLSKDEFSVGNSEKPTYGRSIFHEILNSNSLEHEKTVDRMTQEALSVISAASETTSSVLSTTVFHVLSNAHICDRLKSELNGVMKDPNSSVEWRKLEQLPYLASLPTLVSFAPPRIY